MHVIIIMLTFFGSFAAGLFGRHLGSTGCAFITVFCLFLSFLCSFLGFYDVLLLECFSWFDFKLFSGSYIYLPDNPTGVLILLDRWKQLVAKLHKIGVTINSYAVNLMLYITKAFFINKVAIYYFHRNPSVPLLLDVLYPLVCCLVIKAGLWDALATLSTVLTDLSGGVTEPSVLLSPNYRTPEEGHLAIRRNEIPVHVSSGVFLECFFAGLLVGMVYTLVYW